MLSQIIQRFQEETAPLPVSEFSESVARRIFPDGMRRYQAPIEITLLDFRDQINTTRVVGHNTVSRLRYASGLGDFHRHAYVELVYVFEGTYRLETETEVLTIGEKEFLLIEPTLLHREDFRDARYVALFLCMSRSFFDSLFLRQLEQRQQRELADFILMALYNPQRNRSWLHLQARQSLQAVEQYLALMIDELTAHVSGYDFLLKGYMMRLMDALTPAVYQSLDQTQKRAFQQQLYEKVIDYMTEHMESVRLEDLVQRFHFQKDYFNRLIRKHAQCSYTEVLQRIRLSRAEYLLAHTQLPVTEIVQQTGYRNLTYFYHLFTARYGITPAAYREQARQSS